MTCPNCGAQIPEGATVCPDCSAPVPTAEVSAPALPAKPDGTPLSKQNYLLKAAPAKTKLLTKIALVVGLVCLLVVILAANTVNNGEFTKIPIFTMVLGEEEVDEMEEEMADVLEKVEEAIDEDDDDLIEEFEDEFDISVEELRDALDPVSLNSLAKLGDLMDEDEDYVTIIKAVTTFVTVVAVIGVVLTLLAIYFGQTWLVILTWVLSIPAYAFLTGFGYLALATVAYIALAVLLSKLNKEYKTYKKSVLAK